MRPSVVAVLALAAAACGQESSPQRPLVAGSGSAGSGSAPGSGPITFTAAATHGRLEMTLTNTTPAPVTIATHVVGGVMPHYDWLTVELDGAGGKRTFHFVDDRDESGAITMELGPGAQHVAYADLVRWAVAAGNGGPLLPGTYQVRATWDTTKENHGAAFVATASATLVVEPPGAEGCETAGYKPPAGTILILLGRQAATGRATADVGLYNAGHDPVCVYSHVKTHELHYDWFTILYADGAKYHHGSRQVHLDDSRDKSYPVSVLLAPGQTIWHAIDVDAWARRGRNGKEPLPAGSLYTQVTYDTKNETRVWAGSLLSESFELKVN